MAPQIHLPSDLIVEQNLVRQRRALEPGTELRGDGAAADVVAAFEDKRLEPGLGDRCARRR